MKPAVIFDLDGTAMDSPKHKLPSQAMAEAMQVARKKFYLCAATGRVWSFAKPVLQVLELTDPCIISAGTQICDPRSGKIKWSCNLDPIAVAKVLEIVADYPGCKILDGDYAEDDYWRGGVAPASLDPKAPTSFINIPFVPEAIAARMVERLQAIDTTICLSLISLKPGCRDIHVTDRYATKEHAVVELLKILHVERQDSIGVGDGYNDLHLFNAVHHKVAMGNAVPELKAMADQVIGLASQDGLAEFLRRLTDANGSTP